MTVEWQNHQGKPKKIGKIVIPTGPITTGTIETDKSANFLFKKVNLRVFGNGRINIEIHDQEHPIIINLSTIAEKQFHFRDNHKLTNFRLT